ncbi:MAG: hypothetical protein LUE29_10505 [Lachnospiraceae bacterium]|nr:hypothetical protein [Lachnospiraceae bacterium]
MSITFTDDRSRIFFEGEPIAACPSWLSGRITDASLTYVEDTAYYYLFITWGDEGVDSHVRVGRSRDAKGPYLDPQGRSLNDWDDAEHPTGFLFLSSFLFDDEDGIRGPYGGQLTGRNPSEISGESPVSGVDENSDAAPVKETDSAAGPEQEACGKTDCEDFITVPAGWDCFFTFHKSNNAKVIFPVLFSDDGWPLICPGEAPEGERVIRASYTLKELQGFYECVTFVPSVPQVPYSSNFAALLPNNVQGIMSMQSREWACPISEDADGRVELGGSIRGSYRLDGRVLHLAFAHDRVSLCMCTATDASNGFPTIFLTGMSDSGIAYMLKKITLPQPNHYNRK